MIGWLFLAPIGLAAEPAFGGYVDLDRLVASHPRWPEALELERLAQRWETLAQGLGVESEAGQPLLRPPAGDVAGATSQITNQVESTFDAQIQAFEAHLRHEELKADVQRRLAQERQTRYAQVRARVEREQQEWRNLRQRWPQGLARQQLPRRLAHEAHRRGRPMGGEDRSASRRWQTAFQAGQEQILAWQRTQADRRFGRWLREQFQSLEQELRASRGQPPAALEQPLATRPPDERFGSREALNRELVRLRSDAPRPTPRPLSLADWQGLVAFRQGREATVQEETRRRVQQRARALRQHSEQLRQALRTEVRHRALAWARDRGLTITFDRPTEAVPDLTDPCREQLWPTP